MELPDDPLGLIREAWSRGWRTGAEAANEMLGDALEPEDLHRAVRSGRVLAALGGAGRRRVYVLQGEAREGRRVCLLCRLLPRGVAVDHVFRTL
jgi:hypothetical protein